jgi:hypothetical protein
MSTPRVAEGVIASTGQRHALGNPPSAQRKATKSKGCWPLSAISLAKPIFQPSEFILVKISNVLSTSCLT